MLPSGFNFETTDENFELTSMVGQEHAKKVITFGLNVNQKGYNIYVAVNSGVEKAT